MRGQILLACAAISTCCPAGGRAAESPYVAYISSEDVYVRSGPGKNYYPTAKLKRGDAVEVYRHDPGGWCAIRPPKQSFSWVSARQIDPAEAGLGVVNADRAVVRVGSIFSDVRDVIQVRLDRGERVELVDKQPIADGKWYKIAPPAGEFRWIYKGFLDRHAPLDEVASDEREDGDLSDDDDEDEPPQSTRKRRRPASEIRLTRHDPDADEADEEEEDAPRRRPAERETAKPVRRASKTRDDDSQKSFSRALADLDLDLSAMVVEDPSVWSFEELRARAVRLVDRSPTALERGQARLLSSKIDRFAAIKERHDTIAQLQGETQRRNRQLGAADLVRHETSAEPRFDAVGRLTPVAVRKDGTPPYVLLDARGQTVSYVTPAPGINLRSYIDKQIGVNGQRGFMPELQKPHLNAQHVTVLSGVLR